MNKLERFSRGLMWAMALLIAALAAGCGGGGGDPILGLPSLTSIAVTPASTSIQIGGIQAFTATATYSDGTTSDVTASSNWTSGTPSVASVISTSGFAAGVTSGTSVITAVFGGKSSSGTLTVTAPTLVSISVTPATASIPIDGIQPFAATATFSDGSTRNVTASSSWISGNTSVATVNSTSGAATGVASGTSVITADFGGKSGSGTLTVTAETLVSIAVTPATASIPIDGIQSFIAVATYSDTSTRDVTASSSWTSGTPSVATVNSTSGVAEGILNGTSLITANFGTKSDTATLTVTGATLVSIAVTPATASVRIGDVQPFMATATYSDTTTRDVTTSSSWTSGTPSVATVISTSGVATGVASGTSVITALFKGQSDTGNLTVIGAAGPAPVILGTAGNFVMLAKTGISTTGTTAVIGDIGVSPAAASFITGFGLIMDSTNAFSTSTLVTGKVYAADYAVPTPNNLTTAISDMQTAFIDAAGRTTPDFINLGAGDISGMTLVPGLYKWGTGVSISNAGVTLTGGANDVWIFQIAQDLTIGNNAIVTLGGSAQAKNIFWQVSGQTTIGTTAKVKGNILSQTLISLNTGAALTGRALAQTAVTLNANNIVKP
ncbi:MAG: ice-binding family protein [Burkholderiaceae bacterium]